jgi:hypothetical protein
LSGTSTTLESYETNFHQDLNGDGMIGIPSGTSPSNPASPAAVVTAVNNDTFVFEPRAGAAAAPKAESADGLVSGGSFSYAGMQPPAPLHDAQVAQPQTLLDLTKSDIFSNPDQHDGASVTNFHLADPYADHFIIS